jgi:hypothetical protein
MQDGRGRRTRLIRRNPRTGSAFIVRAVRGARLAALAAVSLLGVSSEAAAHDPLGRAQPSVSTTVSGAGLKRTLVFRVRDVDSGDSIPAATVLVRARDDGGSAIDATVVRVGPQLFRTTLELPRPGRWHVGVRIGGPAVVPTAFSIDVDADSARAAPESSGSSNVALWIGVAAGSLVGAAGVLAAVLIYRSRSASSSRSRSFFAERRMK